MGAQTGAGTACQMGKESAYGTAVVATHVINFSSESVEVTPTKTAEGSLISSLADTAADLMGLKVAGSVGFILRPEFAGFLLKAALGGADTLTQNVGSVTGYHKHAIALAAADASIPSYTLKINRKVSAKKYSGTKISGFSLTAKAGDYVKGSFDIVAKDESSATMESLAALALRAFKCIGATLVVGGTTFDVNQADLKLANNYVDMPPTYGSGLYAPEPPHQARAIDLSWSMPYDTVIDTLADASLTTESNVATIVLTLLSPSMVTGSSPYKIVVTLNNVAITKISRPVSGSGLINASVSGKALAVGATAPIAVEVYDGTSTAY